jgi:uncharacterized lipoprotein YddW (UPF0748 family)
MSPPSTDRRHAAAMAAVAVFATLTVLAGVVWSVRLPPIDVAARAAEASATCHGRPLAAHREVRGMTITTVNNLDWPSRPGLDERAVKAEYRSWLDLAQRLNVNTVFVHVRPSGDAFWPSAFSPWSQWLTGRGDGQDPGWDPLRFMVEETHARNIEFHAWFNPYRASASTGADLSQLAPDHPLRRHPDWAVVYPAGAGGRLYYDPGNPQARRFVEDSMLDAVARYDLDAVFFDDFFYPYPVARQDLPDDATYARYGTGFAGKADWRRHNVNLLVQEMSQRVKAVKPWVKFGISPFGIWRNANTDPLGSPTAGLQSYDDIYADSRLWVRNRWLDYIVPQLYWQIGLPVADYAKLVPWWSQVVAGTGVQLYVAQADYRVGQAGAWQDAGELDRQLEFNRTYPVSGTVHFSAGDMRADRLGAVGRYRAVHWADPALPPTMAGLPFSVPRGPKITTAHRDSDGAITVSWWPAPGTGTATGYAIYRLDGASSAARLVATVRAAGRGEQRWVDHGAAGGRRYRYCVTALERTWHESEPTPSGGAG